MAGKAGLTGAELLQEVERLAGEGLKKGEIARRLGFKAPATFGTQLVRASQQTGKPVPAFRGARGTARKRHVETVEIKARGRGTTFGVNIQQEPLERIGAKPGDRLAVTAGRSRIAITLPRSDKAKATPPEPRKPRLVKGRRGA